jgi:hypothetical protein
VPALLLAGILAFPPILSATFLKESHPDSVFQIGEELTYNVSYASIDIGRVRIKIVDTIRTNDHLSYKALAYIDSYKGVPFVNLHSVYENLINENLYSAWFHSKTKEDNHWREFIYNFEYPRHAIFIEEGIWKSGTIEKRDTLRIDTLYQDGLSLFFLARKYVMTRQKVTIPTVVREKCGTTYLNFTTERTKEEIDAVKYPIDLIHFEGEAGFVGIFGLTGGFEGWFSNDAARVPIIANMKVLIGNVRIELIEWKRSGWAPPRYIETNAK